MSVHSVMNVKPKAIPTNNGIDQDKRSALAHELSIALANTYFLYLKTQNVHWNVSGPMFYSVHKMTEDQYKDMATAIDEIAERIRATGFIAPASFEEFKALSILNESTSIKNTEQMLTMLANDNELCSRGLRNTVERAEQVGDVKTADLFTDRIGIHEQNTWMLRAQLS